MKFTLELIGALIGVSIILYYIADWFDRKWK